MLQTVCVPRLNVRFLREFVFVVAMLPVRRYSQYSTIVYHKKESVFILITDPCLDERVFHSRPLLCSGVNSGPFWRKYKLAVNVKFTFFSDASV
jgi:hypothetical protein